MKHKCDMCWKEGEWGEGWSRWGSVLLEDSGKWLSACSAKCAEKIDVHRESVWLEKYGESLARSELLARKNARKGR